MYRNDLAVMEADDSASFLSSVPFHSAHPRAAAVLKKHVKNPLACSCRHSPYLFSGE